MINALKLVSIQHGHDPREFSLVVGGGGGPMHAAQLSRELGVKEVIVPLYPGLFSAGGMLMTAQRRDFVRSRLSSLRDTSIADVESVFAELQAEARDHFLDESGTSSGALSLSMSCDLRYAGQEHAVTIEVKPGATLAQILADFHVAHERTYTFRVEESDVEFVSYRLKAEARLPRPDLKPIGTGSRSAEAARKKGRWVDFGEAGRHECGILERDFLPAGFEAAGPLVVEEATSTTIVLPGQVLRVDALGFLHIAEQPVSDPAN